MAKLPNYPGVSSFVDRHGVTRYKFRKAGLKPATIPGQPGTPQFDAAYEAAAFGLPIPRKAAEVILHPSAAAVHKTPPASLNACWAKLRERPKFQKLEPATRYQYTYLIEAWLAEPVGSAQRGEGPVAELRPRHIQDSLDKMSASNSVITRLMIKKLMKEARLQDWIEFDPTYGTEPVERDTQPREAWPAHICARFESCWALGTSARTAYELAKWLGVRRSDIARMRWDQMVTKIIDGEPVEGFDFVQFKGRNRKGAFSKFHPISPMLAEALAPLDRTTGTVLVNRHGKPYNMNSIGAAMWGEWCPKAGIPRGYTLHGLRYAMGGMLADAGATAHESRDSLGHATFKEANNYSRTRDQARTSTSGMRKVVKMVRG
jgi:integrase